MSFDRVIGQERPKSILQRALASRHLHHAYFFTGPDGAGKEALAIEFAKALYCSGEGVKPCDQCSLCRRVGQFNHPDFLFLMPIPKNAAVEEEREILDSLVEQPYLRKKPWPNPTISIERIRELRRISMLKPLERYRVIIIAEADKMTDEAANSLLKILEEPPPNMYMILTSSRPLTLPATIFSRCQEIRFSQLTDDQVATALVQTKGVETGAARLIARIVQGDFGRALEWLEEDLEERRESVVELLRVCLRDPLAQIEYVEELQSRYDKRLLKDLLGLILIWFRDVQVLRHGHAHGLDVQEVLVNADRMETLEKFSRAFAEIGFDDIFAEVERSIEWIDRNIQIPLILIVLLLRLQSHLVLKG